MFILLPFYPVSVYMYLSLAVRSRRNGDSQALTTGGRETAWPQLLAPPPPASASVCAAQ